jgi:hypothetical protein
MSTPLTLRYTSSALVHFFTGKLAYRDLAYALRVRPAVVMSKGKAWMIDEANIGG